MFLSKFFCYLPFPFFTIGGIEMKLGISITTFTTDPPRERTTNKQTIKEKLKRDWETRKNRVLGYSCKQASGTEMNWLRKYASYRCTSLLFHACVKTCTYTLYVLSLKDDIVLRSKRHCQRMYLEIVHFFFSLSLSLGSDLLSRTVVQVRNSKCFK